MRAALAACVADRTVCRERRRYRVFSLPLAGHRLSVLLVSRIDRLAPARLAATYGEQAQHLLEIGCGRRNVGVTVAGYAPRDGTLLLEDGHRLPRLSARQRETLAGCVVFTDGLEEVGLQSLTDCLVGYGKPVAMLVGTQGESPPEIVADARQVRLYTVGSDYRAGQEVGRHAAYLGHRKVAYLSLFHHNWWSKERLAGLKDALRSSPHTDTHVYEYVSERGDDTPSMSDEVLTLTDRLRRLSGITELHHSITEGLLRSHRTRLARGMIRWALRRRDVSLWVVDGDITALLCLAELNRRGIEPPEAISLVTFDDSFSMSARRVTAYHFDTAATAEAMISYVLGPTRRRAPRSHGILQPVEPKGTIMARDSLAAV